MILALDSDVESDFQSFCNSRSGFGSSKKMNCNTYSVLILAWIWILSRIFSHLAIPNPYSNPVKSGIVTLLTAMSAILSCLNFLSQLECRQEGKLLLLNRRQGPDEVQLDARALHLPPEVDDAQDVRHRLRRPRHHRRLRGGLLQRQAQQDEPLPGRDGNRI